MENNVYNLASYGAQNTPLMPVALYRRHPFNGHLERARIAGGASKQKLHPL